MSNKKDEKQFYSKVNSSDSSFLSLLTDFTDGQSRRGLLE